MFPKSSIVDVFSREAGKARVEEKGRNDQGADFEHNHPGVLMNVMFKRILLATLYKYFEINSENF